MRNLASVVLIALSVGAGFCFNTSTLQLRESKYSSVEEASPFSTVCPLGWIYAGKLGCIYLNTDKDKVGINWLEAQFECELLEGYLAEVTTEEEQEFLRSITYLIEDWKVWWIGASDSGHESTWIWQHSDLPLTFDNWAENRPNSEEHNQDDCVMMDCENQDCEWVDVDCIHNIEDTISFICQKPQEEVATTTTPNTTPRQTTEEFETTTIPNTTPRSTTEQATTPLIPVRVTSDGLTARSPHCSWTTECDYDYDSKQECANALCVARGYLSGVFVSASNNFCTSSFTSDKIYVWNLYLDEIEYTNRNCEAQITADCVADYSVLQDSCCKPLLIMTASTLDEAKQQCAVDPSCAMFYDNCEKGNDFWKCDASATIYPSVCGSVLYKKE